MYTILVAGAGHGGLTAAAILASAGHNVTVFEKKAEHTLGHDWEDRFTFPLLAQVLGMDEDTFSTEIWRYRGDCAFISPNKEKKIPIHFTPETRQKIMWRAPILEMLIRHAKDCGVQFRFSTEVIGPIVEDGRVCGLNTAHGSVTGDLVIDAAGVFSPVRSNLPEDFGIEQSPRRGDLFYACRTYFNRLPGFPVAREPFEVFLRHNGEAGLSWCCTNDESVDVLIGRIDPLTDAQIEALQAQLRSEHPWMGTEVLHGGQRGFIPVRRPLTVMVANGYAAVGDSAFMTTPMNGMGIDLSLQAGKLLAETVLHAKGDLSAQVLWRYNREFHRRYGAVTAKNDALKCTILTLPAEGVDFLFAEEVVEASDLAGGGKDMTFDALRKKLTRGIKQPDTFLTLLNGLLRGRLVATVYKAPPRVYTREGVLAWSRRIASLDIPIEH
ncbi:MAG: NAD(P)/FAD-dependent oxidoreductase [Oscillospiraceae bacterium]|nr:NAD(P)/FAD-dependent oxidoreductase [Oscillospiraceae bacterium]